MLNLIMDFIVNFKYLLPAILIAICLHEFAHGLVSYKLGDPTPKEEGRLSLNPLNHLDPFGTIALILFGFGWAKPVMVNPTYYKNKKLGMVWVALAGPFMNFIIAFLSIFLLIFLSTRNLIPIDGYFFVLLKYTASINIGLGVFNLIPVPPLDGSKVLGAILPTDKYFAYMKYEMYGQIIIIALLFLGFLNEPLGIALNFVYDSMVQLVFNILSV